MIPVTPPSSSTSAAERSALLAGFSILVTASRRTSEWSAAFTRLGAEVTLSPTLSIEPLDDTDGMVVAMARQRGVSGRLRAGTENGSAATLAPSRTTNWPIMS